MRAETTLDDSGFVRLEVQVARAGLDVCLAGATATARDAREQIQYQKGSGEKYSTLPNRSSAPYEAPVNQSGGLVDTIGTDQENVVGIGADAVAGDGSGQATALEGGTSRMEPRPFMGPASVVGFEAADKRLAEIAPTLGNF